MWNIWKNRNSKVFGHELWSTRGLARLAADDLLMIWVRLGHHPTLKMELRAWRDRIVNVNTSWYSCLFTFPQTSQILDVLNFPSFNESRSDWPLAYCNVPKKNSFNLSSLKGTRIVYGKFYNKVFVIEELAVLQNSTVVYDIINDLARKLSKSRWKWNRQWYLRGGASTDELLAARKWLLAWKN